MQQDFSLLQQKLRTRLHGGKCARFLTIWGHYLLPAQIFISLLFHVKFAVYAAQINSTETDHNYWHSSSNLLTSSRKLSLHPTSLAFHLTLIKAYIKLVNSIRTN